MYVDSRGKEMLQDGKEKKTFWKGNLNLVSSYQISDKKWSVTFVAFEWKQPKTEPWTQEL